MPLCAKGKAFCDYLLFILCIPITFSVSKTDIIANDLVEFLTFKRLGNKYQIQL